MQLIADDMQEIAGCSKSIDVGFYLWHNKAIENKRLQKMFFQTLCALSAEKKLSASKPIKNKITKKKKRRYLSWLKLKPSKQFSLQFLFR